MIRQRLKQPPCVRIGVETLGRSSEDAHDRFGELPSREWDESSKNVSRLRPCIRIRPQVGRGECQPDPNSIAIGNIPRYLAKKRLNLLVYPSPVRLLDV